MPHMSKAALGQAASTKTPMNPCFSVKLMVQIFILLKRSVLLLASSTSASNSESELPDMRAILATEYGGISPTAVPKPHSMHGTVTRAHSLRKVTVLSSLGPLTVEQSSLQGCWYQGTRPTVVRQASAALTTCMMCGKRNINPECKPVPKPTEERMPRMIHQEASIMANSICHRMAPSFPPQTGGAKSSGAKLSFSANQSATEGASTSQTTGFLKKPPRLLTTKLVTYLMKSGSATCGLVIKVIFSRSSFSFAR
mmetsp:Transcript_70480/g.229171  ORF Transcript_70480/g.229171 Transcript_70480/m.229171 type:complete len:254 (+) Transcript_70480:698-1459(+)